MRMQKGKAGNAASNVSEKKSKLKKATMVLGPTPEPTPPVPTPSPNPEPTPPTPTPAPTPPAGSDLPYGADTIYNIPLLKIRVAPQVRSHVTTTEAPFLSLKESIRERGVLSPVILVREAADSFLLVSGERRYWACSSLKMETIPARIIAGIDDPTDRIALQLIENMIREDLDPIDEAQGYLDYLLGKRPGVAVASIVNDLVTFNMDPSRLPEEVQAICRALERMAGKTAGTIRSPHRPPRPAHGDPGGGPVPEDRHGPWLSSGNAPGPSRTPHDLPEPAPDAPEPGGPEEEVGKEIRD